MTESHISLKINIVNSKQRRQAEKKSMAFHDVTETKEVSDESRKNCEI
jgi:hypothetical protein